jgi:hypothetical protein
MKRLLQTRHQTEEKSFLPFVYNSNCSKCVCNIIFSEVKFVSPFKKTVS